MNRSRRSFVALLVSGVLSVASGTNMWSHQRRKREARRLLEEYEVRVTQIESLLRNIIISGEYGASVRVLEKLAWVLIEYGRKLGEGEMPFADEWPPIIEAYRPGIQQPMQEFNGQLSSWLLLDEDRFDDGHLVDMLDTIVVVKVRLRGAFNEL